ncbi:unnamed protein product [Victoria cruziana]
MVVVLARRFLGRIRPLPHVNRFAYFPFGYGYRRHVGNSRARPGVSVSNFTNSMDFMRSRFAGDRFGNVFIVLGLVLGLGRASTPALSSEEDENTESRQEMRENSSNDGPPRGLAGLLREADDRELASELSLHKSSMLHSATANGGDLGSSRVPVVSSGFRKLKIFIGYDPREDLAFEVCRYSILKRSSIPVEISPIMQSDLRKRNLYWRERGPTESTEFSFSRFLTPFLAGFDGWALFVDCDFLYRTDIKELVELIEDKYAVMCVQHDYAPKETTKMDGTIQTTYPRKNWSSMVLYNCGHPRNRALTPEVVNTQTGAFLHRFMWLEDSDIGSIPFVWNFLVGHNRVVDDDPKTYPKAIHYTLGGPWFERWKDCEFADLWTKEMEEYQATRLTLNTNVVEPEYGNSRDPQYQCG